MAEICGQNCFCGLDWARPLQVVKCFDSLVIYIVVQGLLLHRHIDGASHLLKSAEVSMLASIFMA